MSGTKAGGIKAKATNLKKYGENYYADIGRKGGSVCGKKSGFAYGDNSKRFGTIGGKRSRKGYKLLRVEGKMGIYQKLETGEVVKFGI